MFVVLIVIFFVFLCFIFYFDLKCKNLFNFFYNLFDVWVEKLSEVKIGVYDLENVYEGCIMDVFRDGMVDY